MKNPSMQWDWPTKGDLTIHRKVRVQFSEMHFDYNPTRTTRPNIPATVILAVLATGAVYVLGFLFLLIFEK